MANLNPPAEPTTQEIAAPHAVAQTSETHPRPSVAEALERGQSRQGNEGPQRVVWISFFVALALLLAFGVAAGVRHWRATPPAVEPKGLPFQG